MQKFHVAVRPCPCAAAAPSRSRTAGRAPCAVQL
uniref:Uncharacterized protein n=1 Tax=Arundo donax TaxID=35708 RepID=A0A0A9AJZ9_ARUDO